MKEIRPTQLEKIEKPVLGLFSVTHFDPHLTLYHGNEKGPGPVTWHTYVELQYPPSLGDGTKSARLFLRKPRRPHF